MNELHSKVRFSNWYLTIFLMVVVILTLAAFFTHTEPILVAYALRTGVGMYFVLALQNCWDFRNPRSDRAFVLLVSFGVASVLSYVAPADTWLADAALLINLCVSSRYLWAESKRRNAEWMAILEKAKRDRMSRLVW